MAKKMTFNAVANVSKHMKNMGAVDSKAFTVGFLVSGVSTNGTNVVKPTSLKAFVEANADRFESKSQCAKDFYRNLRLFTNAGQADFNHRVTNGNRLAMMRESATGRATYTLFEPKAETGGSDSGKAAVVAENAKLKAQLSKLMSVLKTAGLLEDEETVAAE